MIYKTEAEARERGLKLMGMIPDGVSKTLRVHENMGWHYSVKVGPFKIHEYQYGTNVSYGCLCGEDEFSGASWMGGDHSTSYHTPMEAMEACVGNGREWLYPMESLMSKAEEVLSILKENQG